MRTCYLHASIDNIAMFIRCSSPIFSSSSHKIGLVALSLLSFYSYDYQFQKSFTIAEQIYYLKNVIESIIRVHYYLSLQMI